MINSATSVLIGTSYSIATPLKNGGPLYSLHLIVIAYGNDGALSPALQRKSLTVPVDPFANPRAVLILHRIITLAPMAKYNGNERFLATLSGYTELPFELCVAFILTIGD